MSRDEIIEQATKTMHAEVCCPCDPQGCDWTHTREVRYARALADAGLLTQPRTTRADAWRHRRTQPMPTGRPVRPDRTEDARTALQAVLDLHNDSGDGLCNECSDGFLVNHPCPTVRAIQDAIGDPQ